LGPAIATALTLRTVFRLALRQTEGPIGSIISLLGLDLAVPDHTTLSRRAETLDMVRPRPGSRPMHLLVDSTGLKLCGSAEWLLEKHGTKTRRSWRKLQIAVDADTGQIAAAALTTNEVNDASQAGTLHVKPFGGRRSPFRKRGYAKGCKADGGSTRFPFRTLFQNSL
jgi:Transposase DDE domain